MKVFELTPVNGRKSFNGKCRVEQENGISFLYSFNTKVAHFEHENNKMVINGYYSATTATHINAFLDYYGFETCDKQQMLNYNDL